MARKREHEALDAEATGLRELLEFLRSRPEQEALEIFRRLRSGDTPQAVLKFVREGDLLIQSFPKSPSVYSSGVPRDCSPLQVHLALHFPNVYHITLPATTASFSDDHDPSKAQRKDGGYLWRPASQRLSPEKSHEGQAPSTRQLPDIQYENYVDERLNQAFCYPWTTVITDDKLFRILLSIYFTWIHPSFCLLDRDCFLEDLIGLRSKHCSPCLVNAILILPYVSGISSPTSRCDADVVGRTAPLRTA